MRSQEDKKYGSVLPFNLNWNRKCEDLIEEIVPKPYKHQDDFDNSTVRILNKLISTEATDVNHYNQKINVNGQSVTLRELHISQIKKYISRANGLLEEFNNNHEHLQLFTDHKTPEDLFMIFAPLYCAAETEFKLKLTWNTIILVLLKHDDKHYTRLLLNYINGPLTSHSETFRMICTVFVKFLSMSQEELSKEFKTLTFVRK